MPVYQSKIKKIYTDYITREVCRVAVLLKFYAYIVLVNRQRAFVILRSTEQNNTIDMTNNMFSTEQYVLN